MTRNASRIGGGQGVVPIHMALAARHRGMEASQREARCGVVEGPISPVRRAVARLASLRESGGRMRRIIRGLEVGQVAVHASRVRRRQVVIPIHVALGALQRRMRAGQRESRGRVVEGRIPP